MAVLSEIHGESQPRGAAQFFYGAGLSGGGVLDRLRLVEHDVVELRLPVGDDVTPQRAVGCEDEIVLGQRRRLADPRIAGVVEHPQRGRELAGLLHPVEDEALGHDDERGPMGDAAVAEQSLPPHEHRQDLDRLAEADAAG